MTILVPPSKLIMANAPILAGTTARADLCGNPTTTSSEAALTAWNGVIEGVMAHAADTPVHLMAALEADPQFALALAARGIMLLTLARGEFLPAARSALAESEASMAIRPVSPRERLFARALSQWLDGMPLAAADTLESALVEHPNDALAFKFGHAIRFMAGDRAGMLRSSERGGKRFAEESPLAGYVLGCRAFALEESGRYDEAQIIGRRAIELAPRDAWGRHAVAHVMEMTGRSDEGADFLSGSVASWAHCNNFGGHMFWHLALFQLELGRIDAVFDLYDSAIRANRTDDFRDIANAASLLLRLELLGHAVGDRWTEMGEIAARRVTDRQLVFADLHYLLALLRSGKAADSGALVATLMGEGSSHDAQVAAMVGAQAAEGLVAFEAGDHDRAATRLGAARDAILAVGGSNAQRDLFEQIFVEALVRAGRFDEAERVLSQRLAARGGRSALAERLTRRIGTHSRAMPLTSIAAAAISAARIPMHH